MKKIYILLAFLLTGTSLIKAQDTLLFENFELNSFYAHKDSLDILPGNITDTMWHSVDVDNIPDGSGKNRANGWFPAYPFSKVDAYPTGYTGTSGPDTNTVLAANSWNNNGESSAGLEDNWLVTPSIKLGTCDTLFWKSAPSQTPRYLDGYEVLISVTDNNDYGFTTAFGGGVLFTGAEMTALSSTTEDTVYADFTFAPTTGSPTPFVHGQDGTYIDFVNLTAAHQLHNGQLRPFYKSLAAYHDKNVFIAFHHNSHDDNLISIDDVMIRGTVSNPNAGIGESTLNALKLSVYPNPASDEVQVNYALTSDAAVTINLYDLAGKLVYSVSNGTQMEGRHFAHINTSDLAKGFYTVNVTTGTSSSNSKLIVR